MKLLMITWTDVFEGIGAFCEWIFKGMRMLAHGPNVIFGSLVIIGLFYWIMRLRRYKKESLRNGTVE